MNTYTDDVLSTQEGEAMVDEAFQQLLDSYLASNHRKKVEIITKAFNFARHAHKGVRRLSGEPYIMHPLAVAQIACSEIGLGSTSICSALLHDVVEDTDYTVEDIANIFGDKIAQIVDGLTKISGGIFGDKASLQAENFRKLLLTMSDDIRVILIKICDRLHNMRTLASQPANKQYKIAGETLYIYAPLANRLGLNKIKTELEDLSFRYEHPEEYEMIQAKLAMTQEQRTALFEEFTAPIHTALDAMGLKYEIKARVKAPYSIWTKMQTKHVTFDEIYDILAVRIIFHPKEDVSEINECFNIYVAITSIYKSHPDRMRDWLSRPKANGYQALHVTLMSHLGQWIEVQIRSERMDEIAEHGFAAHWKYKDGGIVVEREEDRELENWLGTIKEILDDPQPDAMDFLDSIKLNLFASEIFVFTPKGEIKTLPAGSTALDFAFIIHSFLGTHCIGAKVNHKLVPLSHKLNSGDQVEIITSKSQHVMPDWINIVYTAKARNKIQVALRKDIRYVQRQGEEMLKAFFEENELTVTTAILDKLTKLHELAKRDDLYYAIGNKDIELGDKDKDVALGKKENNTGGGWRKYVPFVKSTPAKEEKKETQTNNITVNSANELFVVGKDFNKKKPIFITDENIGNFIFPSCCNCVPGDDILGFINNKKHIEIHNRACSVANKLKSSFGNRIIDAKWATKEQFFEATIMLKGIDELGLLNKITQVLSRDLNINMTKLIISSENGIAEGSINLRVHHRDEVERIIKELKEIKALTEIKQTT